MRILVVTTTILFGLCSNKNFIPFTIAEAAAAAAETTNNNTTSIDELLIETNNSPEKISQFEPNIFLRETSCQNNGQNNNDNDTTENNESSSSTLSLSCNKYQIKTLTSNPQRCIQITPPTTSTSTDETKKTLISCINYENWHDGTNGCEPYTQNKEWCQKYGTNSRKDPSSPTATQACCACGGGITNYQPHYSKGDIVTHISYPKCQFQIKEINQDYVSYYTIQVMEDCGEDIIQLQRSGRYYRHVETKEYVKGREFRVGSESDLSHVFPIELRKCRENIPEQEFWVIPVVNEESSEEYNDETQQFILKHVLTNITLGPPLTPKKKKNKSTKNEDGSMDDNIVTLRRVFMEEEKQFPNSDVYLRIEDSSSSSSSSTKQPPVILINGHFGKSDVSKPEWQTSTSTHDQVSFGMWKLEQMNSSTIDGETNSRYGHDAHAKWIEERITSGTCSASSNPEQCNVESDGLEYLKQLPPWTLLDVERNSPKAEVKQRFRELSRRFHPDKRGGKLFEQIFLLLQQAYDGLKSSDSREKEAFKANAEVEAQLFPYSRFVVELLPSHWTLVGNGTRDERYVINMTSSKPDNEQVNDMEESSSSSSPSLVESMTNQTQVWLLFFYSPRCSMSRTVVTFLELAAETLQDDNIRVGAYGCGIYGDSLEESKKKGFSGWQSDPICSQFQRPETPNTHVVVESLIGYENENENGDMTSFGKRVAKFRTFYSAAAAGTAYDLWPRKFIDFAMESKYAWEDSSLVRFVTKDDFNDPSFNGTTRILVFTDERNKELHEVHEAIISSLPNIARRLADADILVGTVACASESEDDSDVIDCSTLGVEFLPDIKIFRANQTVGISLLSEAFVERRDVQIALESMANTFTAFLGLEEGSVLDKTEEDEDTSEEEASAGGSCGTPMNYDVDENLAKLEAADEVEKLDAPEEEKEETESEEQSNIDSGDETQKLGQDSSKPKLAKPTEKPKLAERSTRSGGNLPQYDKRKSSQGRRSGGKIISGASGGGGGGAISG